MNPSIPARRWERWCLLLADAAICAAVWSIVCTLLLLLSAPPGLCSSEHRRTSSESVQQCTIHGRVAGTKVLNTDPLNKSAVTLNRVDEASSKVFKPPTDGTVINSSMNCTY